MKSVGLSEELAKMLQAVEKADEAASKALYKGAGIMADAYKAAANSIPTEKNRFVKPGDPPRHATVAEKNAIARGLGIAKFAHDDDGVDTSVGLNNAGYAANIKTEKYPNGKPIPLIANSINSGSSFIIKYPFARMAEAAARTKAVQAMDAEGQRILDEVTNNG